MAYHIYHMKENMTWMDLFRTSYPSRYNILHFLPKVEDVVREDRDTGEQYRNFTLVPQNVYGRLPVNKDQCAYLHFACEEGDLMVNVPHSVIDAVLEGVHDLEWLRDIASYANMLSQDIYRNNYLNCEDEDDDYDPIQDAWMSYWANLEEFISEKMA
jgi:hypothetical protein